MRLLVLPLPSTRTIVVRSCFLFLLLNGDCLAVVQIRRAVDNDGVSDHETGDNFGIRTSRAAHGYGAALQAILSYEEDDLITAVVVDGALRNQRNCRSLCARLLLPFVAEESDLDAHVGKNPWVKLVERNADFYRGLLAVGGRNDRAHMAGDFPIRIRIQDPGYVLTVLNAGDVRLVDIDFDLVGVHVHDGGDAGAGEAAARGDRRDHFADLGVFGDHDASEGRFDRTVVDGLLGFDDACL